MLELLSEARRAAAACAAAPAWAVPDGELVACLAEAWAGVQQLTAVVAHLVWQAQSRGMPRVHGASSTTVWLRRQLRVSCGAGKQLAKLAEALDARPAVDGAVCAGSVSAEQAVTIAAVMGTLPSGLGGEALGEAESMLVGWARDVDPALLEKFGAGLVEYVAPETVERRDKALLDRQDRAFGRRGFTMSPIGEGMVRLSGYLDAVGAATVNAALDPLCHPRGDDPAGPRTPAQRRADALVDVCAGALRGDVRLPGQGGDAAQVVVTVPFTTLVDGLAGAAGRGGVPRRRRAGGAGGNADADPGPAPASGPAPVRCDDEAGRDVGAGVDSEARFDGEVGLDAAGAGGAEGGGWLDTGVPISAGQARMLACDAQIVPAVLGGESQVLDLGRARRLFSGSVRRALVLRDGGCSFPGCDRPARWAEGHHVRGWPDGGLTEPGNGCLVCRFHHRLLHDGSGWQVRIAVDGFPEYLPPVAVDPARRPLRNTYHRRE